jgi:Cft2 family RNA processing exonuclease
MQVLKTSYVPSLALSGEIKLKIRVLGAAREVGGSCIAVETEKCKIALDYGIKLDGVTDEYPKNFDAIVISHAHLDHSGSLLRLSKSRNPQTIIGSKLTREVTIDLLKDMIKIQKTKPDGEVYETEVADKIKNQWSSGESVKLPGMSIDLTSAGHVAGARITKVVSEGKTILYTGDFCIHDTEILDGCDLKALPQEPDVLISESTYGGKVRPPRKELTSQLLRSLSGRMRRRNNILIPTFAFHRSQEMAKRIDQAMADGSLPKYNAYVISTLANKVTAHFNANKQAFSEEIQLQSQPFEYKHVKHVDRTEEVEEPAIVICTPGFGHAGASLELLTDWAESEDNSVILTSGFLPADSPLKLAKEKRYFKAVDGDKIPVNADFETIELSGHADQNELVELVRMVKPKRTVLVHGDLLQAEALSQKLVGLTEVLIPEKADIITV